MYLFTSFNYKLFTGLVFVLLFAGACIKVKRKEATPIQPALENASKQQLIAEINGRAQLNSLRAKMDVKFEDLSASDIGVSEKYQTADGDLIVQRPANIFLKIEVPAVKIDIAQMSSNGDTFRVAVLEDGGDGKLKRFLSGTNKADYSKLQKTVSEITANVKDDKGKSAPKSVSVFSNIRPQHFTDALLIRPLPPATESKYFYVQSEIFQEEVDPTMKKGSVLARVNRGYYLLEELKQTADGDLMMTRRFWFDRVGKIRLARQQTFDGSGATQSDVIYGNEGKFTDTGEVIMPMRIELTRPQEKYRMTLTYQSPESVQVGKEWKQDIFTLKNRWNLPEVDLDKKLEEAMKLAKETTAGNNN
jgi:hypothetical protein